jgi:hypothetical protein
MRRLCGAVVIALAALAAPAPSSATVVGGLQAISGSSPFPADGCGVPGQRNAGTEGEPALAVNPRDPRNLVAVWQQDRFTIDGGALSDVVGVTKDGGRTWKQVLVPGISRCTGGADERASDPWLSFGPDGRLYLSVLTFTEHPELAGKAGPTALRVSTSTDGGLTWSQPVVVGDAGIYEDRPSVTADPGRPGTAYLTWVRRSGELGFDGTELFSKTVDGGRTWSASRALTQLVPGTGPDPLFVDVFPDGTLLNLYVVANTSVFLPDGQPRKPFQVISRRSVNGGRSWGRAVTVGSIQPPSAPRDPDSGAPVRAFNIASVGIAPDGTAYVAWNVIGSPGSSQIVFSKSIDGGRSWSKPAAVARVPSQAFLPSLAVGGDGTVGVYWDDFRNDRRGDGQLTTDVFYALSKNGGASWRQGHLAGPFDALTAPPTDSTAVAGRFLGDYQGIAGLRDGSIATLFAQGRPQARAGGTDVFFALLHQAGRVVKPRLKLTLRRTGRRLRAEITSGGKPVVGAKVRALGRTHRTDSRGRATFAVPSSGRIVVVALGRSYTRTSAAG